MGSQYISHSFHVVRTELVLNVKWIRMKEVKLGKKKKYNMNTEINYKINAIMAIFYN